MIVHYWSTHEDNLEVNTASLSYKALTLFAVSVYPRVSDLVSLARNRLQLSAPAMRFCHLGTKELRSLKVFTRQDGIPGVDYLRVCAVLAMQACVERTSSFLYIHSDTVYPFPHAFMSLVPNRATSLHFPVGAKTCS